VKANLFLAAFARRAVAAPLAAMVLGFLLR